MSRKYTLQSKIDQWVVKKEDLSALFTLFLKRFSNSPNTEIALSFDHEEEGFSKFEEFNTCVQKELLASKRKLKTITLSGVKARTSNSSKYAKVTIYFEFDKADFLIMGTGNQEVGDWVQGFNTDIEALFRSFKPDEKIVSYIKNADKERYKYSDSVIFFDYLNQLEGVVSNDTAQDRNILIQDSQVHFGEGDNVKGDKVANISEGKESFIEKVFWRVLVVLIVGVAVTAIVYWLGFAQ